MAASVAAGTNDRKFDDEFHMCGPQESTYSCTYGDE